MVELGVSAEDLDDLEGGFRGVGEEAGALDPAVELKRVFRRGGAVEDVVDKGRVKFRDEGADGVLEARGPRAVGHHLADGEFEIVLARGNNGWGLGLRGGRRGVVGFGESFGGGEGGERVWMESGCPSEKLGIGKQSHGIGGVVVC